MNDENRPTHQPAYTKPIPVKDRPEPAPKLSEADLSASLHKGMENASRRIKLVQSLDTLLQHNPDLIDQFEAEVASCKAAIESRNAKASSAA